MLALQAREAFPHHEKPDFSEMCWIAICLVAQAFNLVTFGSFLYGQVAKKS